MSICRKQENQLQIQNEPTVEVLYQKMGDRWFAFSLINDELFVGSISQMEIDSSLVFKTNSFEKLNSARKYWD